MVDSKPTYGELERRCAAAEAALRAIQPGTGARGNGEEASLRARLVESEERAERITRMLLAIRNVNQVLVQEDNPQRLIERVCLSLTETLGFDCAWIALLDERGEEVEHTASAGLDESFAQLHQQLGRRELPTCMQAALAGGETVIIEAPEAQCPGCPLAGGYGERAGLAQRLLIGGKARGLLAASAPRRFARDQEVLGLFRDMAADVAFGLQKAAQVLALKESEERFVTAFRTSPYGITITRVRDGRFIEVNQAFTTITGFTREEALTSSSLLLNLWVNADDRQEIVRGLLEGKEIVRREVRFRRRDGALFTSLFSAQAISPRGEPCILSSIEDISERVQADEALQISERRHRLLADNASDVIWTMDLDGRITYVSPSVERVRGYTPAEVMRQSLDEVLTPSSAAIVMAVLGQAREAARVQKRVPAFRGEVEQPRKDGTTVWMEISASGMYDAEGEFAGILGVSRDITDRRRAEAALVESERKWRNVLVDAPQIGISLDPEARIVFANAHFLRLTGWEEHEVLGRDWFGLFIPAEIRERVREIFRAVMSGGDTRGFSSFENDIVTRSGERRAIAWSNVITKNLTGTVVDVTCLGVDLTERRRAEEEQRALQAQLIHSQKMESVGRLAGGVAHDFNNLLQAVLSATQVAKLQAGDGRLATKLEEIEGYARRGAALTRQLLLFSRRQRSERERLDLAAVVNDEALMLRRLLPESITLSVESIGDAMPVLGDAGQVSQVIANLAVNARDAMPDGGRLVIRTWRRGSELVLEVADTGCGLSAEVRDHLFEPFFTTKGVGKGTGLGLAVVFGIVTDLGGRIEVDSEPGAGSCFRVVLPADSQEAEAAGPAPDVTAAGSEGKGERVLLVEDEEGARVGLAEILDVLGYRATVAASGEEALQLPVEPGFDLLLSDLMLPGITGGRLASLLRDRWPGMGVILMSGYLEDERVRHELPPGARFLQKPFDLEMLGRELRAALDAHAS